MNLTSRWTETPVRLVALVLLFALAAITIGWAAVALPPFWLTFVLALMIGVLVLARPITGIFPSMMKC